MQTELERSTKRFSNLGLIGGCGSSGTTLLVHLLSRNSEIGSGPEFNCFNHPEIYDIQLLRNQWRHLKRGKAIPAGYIDVPVFMTHRDHYKIDNELIESWLVQASSTADFAWQLKVHLHRVLDCRIVLEKSPTNVYAFRLARDSLPGVRLIHMIRDGRDVAVSLMRRGFNLFGAGSRWLYDTLCGLAARGSADLLEIRYETLVRDTDQVICSALAHLGVHTSQGKQLRNRTGVAGLYSEDWTARSEPRAWNQTPSDPISDRSVGQYLTSLSRSDLSRLCRIRVRSELDLHVGLPRTFGDLLDHMGYGAPEHSEPSLADRVRDRKLILQDYSRRLGRFTAREYWRLPRRYTAIES